MELRLVTLLGDSQDGGRQPEGVGEGGKTHGETEMREGVSWEGHDEETPNASGRNPMVTLYPRFSRLPSGIIRSSHLTIPYPSH